MRTMNKYSDQLVYLVINHLTRRLNLISRNRDWLKTPLVTARDWTELYDNYYNCLQQCDIFEKEDFESIVRLMADGKLLASDIERLLNNRDARALRKFVLNLEKEN